MNTRAKKIRGRGTANKVDARFLNFQREVFYDEWDAQQEDKRLITKVTEEKARTIISRNSSPDIPFELSINPYRGCEHGCNYCYARPSHAYLDLSAGIDFETKLYAKVNAVHRKKQYTAAYRTSLRFTPRGVGDGFPCRGNN